MNAIHNLSFEDHPHIGSSGINKWILNHYAYPQIQSSIIREFLFSKKHQAPFTFYLLCTLIIDFYNYCFKSTKLPVNPVTPEAFSSYIEDQDISQSQVRILRSLYKWLYPSHNATHLKGKLRKRYHESSHPFVKDYINNLAHLGDTTETLINNSKSLNNFLEFLCTVYVEFQEYTFYSIPVFQVRTEHLEEYRVVLLRKVKSKEYGIGYASLIFYVIRSFFRFLYYKKLISKDITVETSPIRTINKYRYREVPTEKELSNLFNLLSIYTDQPEYFQLAFGLMLYLGLRPAEVCHLSWRDVNLEARTLIVGGKTKKYHILPIPDVVYIYFQKALRIQHNGGQYLFHQNPKFFQMEMYGIYKVLSLMANWTYPGGLYLFRHTFITKLSEQGCPPQLLMKLARHDNPETTSLYIHRSREKLTSAINQLSYFEEED